MWNSHIHLEKLENFRSSVLSNVLPTIYFKNINEKTACAPSGLILKYGILRKNTSPMYGIFTTKKFKKGEFICTWGGIHVLDNQDLKTVLNYHHLKNYGLAYRVESTDYYACAPLNARGFPLTDGPLAPFINEPNTKTITLLSDDKIVITNREPDDYYYQNICVHAIRQRLNKERGILGGNIGPVFFAHRDIAIGEELVWSYGREFDRSGYEDQVPQEDSLGCDLVQRIIFDELTHISDVKNNDKLFMKLNGVLGVRQIEQLTKERDSFVRKLNNDIGEGDDVEDTPVSRRGRRETSSIRVDSIEKILSEIKSELGKKLNSNNKSLPHREYVKETLMPILDEYYKIIYDDMEEIQKEGLWKFLELMFTHFANDLKYLLMSDGSSNELVFDKNKYANKVQKGETAASWTIKSFEDEYPKSSSYAERFFLMIDRMNEAYKYEYPGEGDTSKLDHPNRSKIRKTE